MKMEQNNSVLFLTMEQSGHSVASTPSFISVGIPGKPHAGPNEQYAGEGIFLTQHRDS